MKPTGDAGIPATTAKSDLTAAVRLTAAINRPGPLTYLAFAAGWAGIYAAYRDSWLGVALAGLCTLGGLLAIRRGRNLARKQRARLEGAVAASAARNRELELLRKLGSTLLGVRSSGELLEEVVQLSASLLQAAGGAIMLVAEEGRFLRIAAGSGLLRSSGGGLLPIEKSLAGYAVLNDEAITSDNMEHDPRSFPIDTMPAELDRAICVPLRSSGVVIGAGDEGSSAG